MTLVWSEFIHFLASLSRTDGIQYSVNIFMEMMTLHERQSVAFWNTILSDINLCANPWPFIWICLLMLRYRCLSSRCFCHSRFTDVQQKKKHKKNLQMDYIFLQDDFLLCRSIKRCLDGWSNFSIPYWAVRALIHTVDVALFFRATIHSASTGLFYGVWCENGSGSSETEDAANAMSIGRKILIFSFKANAGLSSSLFLTHLHMGKDVHFQPTLSASYIIGMTRPSDNTLRCDKSVPSHLFITESQLAIFQILFISVRE